MNRGTTKANGLVTDWTQLTALLHPSALRLTLGCSQPLYTGVENLTALIWSLSDPVNLLQPSKSFQSETWAKSPIFVSFEHRLQLPVLTTNLAAPKDSIPQTCSLLPQTHTHGAWRWQALPHSSLLHLHNCPCVLP